MTTDGQLLPQQQQEAPMTANSNRTLSSSMGFGVESIEGHQRISSNGDRNQDHTTFDRHQSSHCSSGLQDFDDTDPDVIPNQYGNFIKLYS